jgi:hypothetical protein
MPSWREHQHYSGHDDCAGCFLVTIRGDYDLSVGLREALNNAHDEINLDEPDEASEKRMVVVEWSRVLTPTQGNGAQLFLSRSIHRVRIRPDISGWDDVCKDGCLQVRGDGLIAAFADALSALPRGTDSIAGVEHTLKFHDPQRLAHHTDLYREISAIEMAVRECLAVIFLRAYPDRPYNFLDRTKVLTTPKDEKPTPVDMATRHECELFHILLSDYSNLNDPTEIRVQGLAQKIREALSFEALKDALVAFPITSDDHSGFIAALRGLLDPIERIRNPVCHNRTITLRAWVNYENAREKIWERIRQFWEKECGG